MGQAGGGRGGAEGAGGGGGEGGTGGGAREACKSMRIAIVCIGSRGDVDPFCALGKELQALGHSVCLITHDDSAEYVAQHGIEFAGLGTDPVEARQSEAGQAVDKAGACGKLAALKGFFHPLVIDWATKAHAALKQGDEKPDLCILSTLAVSIVTPACEAVRSSFRNRDFWLPTYSE
jgi:hypothetical protein